MIMLRILSQMDMPILVAMSVLTASFVLSLFRLGLALARSGRKT